jgi:hypothetical protein
VKDCCDNFIKDPLIAKPFSWVFMNVSIPTVGGFQVPARTGRLEDFPEQINDSSVQLTPVQIEVLFVLDKSASEPVL